MAFVWLQYYWREPFRSVFWQIWIPTSPSFFCLVFQRARNGNWEQILLILPFSQPIGIQILPNLNFRQVFFAKSFQPRTWWNKTPEIPSVWKHHDVYWIYWWVGLSKNWGWDCQTTQSQHHDVYWPQPHKHGRDLKKLECWISRLSATMRNLTAPATARQGWLKWMRHFEPPSWYCGWKGNPAPGMVESLSGWWCNSHLEKWWSSSMGRMTSPAYYGK